jgi:hypothetical protein
LSTPLVSQILATVIDPDGRGVDLIEERWEHIMSSHPELAGRRADVLDTVRVPSRRLLGPTVGEEWFYRENIGPSRWLKVVVRYDSIERGRIVTAFARRSMP